MSNNKTDYLENALINAVLRGIPYTSPSNVYVGLFTTSPAEDGTGGVEVTGGSYARQVISFTAPSQLSGGAFTSNASTISFPVATSGWGTITTIGIFDDANAGNLLYVGPAGTPKTVATGDQLTFPTGALTVTES